MHEIRPSSTQAHTSGLFHIFLDAKKTKKKPEYCLHACRRNRMFDSYGQTKDVIRLVSIIDKNEPHATICHCYEDILASSPG